MISTSSAGHGINGRRVLVTGANGFVGAHLTRALLREGAHVTALIRPSASLWRLSEIQTLLRIVRARLDELSDDRIAADLGPVDLVYHLAAAGTNQSEHDASLMLEANVFGTYRVLTLAQRLGAGRVVCAGTGLEYGVVTMASETTLPRPLTPYSASKAAAWLFAHAYAAREGLSLVTLRTFSVYGPAQDRCFLIPYVVMRAVADRPIDLTGGTQLRDLVFVDDAIDAFIAAGTAADASGQTFNVSSGSPVAVRDVARMIVTLAGSASPINLGARSYSSCELWSSSGSFEKIQRHLEWSPRTPLQDGLVQTIDWFRHQAPRYPDSYSD